MTTKPIVVGTDSSAQAVRAVEWAAREAALRGAPLRIVSVAVLLPRMHEPAQQPAIDTVTTRITRARDEALTIAARAASAVAPGLKVETAPLEGPPAEAVTRSGSDAQLLVVGSHGAGALAAMTFGSVSRFVAEHASCPVVVVRQTPETPLDLVVVGVRTLENCGAAISFAFEEASLRKAALRAIHVRESHDGPAGQEAMDLEDLLSDARTRYPGVRASQEVASGSPGRVLAELSALADLVVLGRRTATSRLAPESARTVHAVVGHAHGPVAIIPAKNS
jgi:nucleotide-binding universal stress UspA family protein